MPIKYISGMIKLWRSEDTIELKNYKVHPAYSKKQAKKI